MTNNFDIIADYMMELDIPKSYNTKNDLYFDVQLIRRGKDNPGMPAANYTFKTYYVDCIDSFERYKDEIIKCCNIFKLRAYVSVNVKSKSKSCLDVMAKYASNLSTGDCRKPWKVFSSICGGQTCKEKRWIVDCDENECEDLQYLVSITKIVINECESKYEKPIIMTIPTHSGYHIITHPFNLEKFKKMIVENGLNVPEVKKNHLTLLYENISRKSIKYLKE